MCERCESGADKPLITRRPKLWNLQEKLHCPVIGTCLTLEELTRVARKSGFSGDIRDDYRLHVEAVSLSCSRNEAAETMHKMLEKKFSLDVARCNRLKSDAEVLAWWREHLERGLVAGPMWAALTHKAASVETRQRIYADVHMLSHQVGAGLAADARRLEWLEKENGQLRQRQVALQEDAGDLARETARLREQVQRDQAAAREREARLETLLRRVEELESGQAMTALGQRLFHAEVRAAQVNEVESRFQQMREKIGVLRAEKVRLARELEEAGQERDALERLWLAEQAEPCGGDCDQCQSGISGRCVLCVGGRATLLPQYRQLAQRLGVRLIHHDGGREEALARLPDLLNASDAVICPTDCVGHLAYYQLKKHCKQNGKPCVLAKSSGVAGFAAALHRLAQGRADIQSQT